MISWKELEGGPDGIAMSFHGIVDIFSVSAAHGCDDGYLPLAAVCNDESVALQQAGYGQLQFAQAVAFEGIDSGLIEDEIGPEIVEYQWHAAP